MPPKRRDKEKDGETKVSDDHEQFLQAFEKPTQIYRYLRTRNMCKPIFLYRTLSYMKHRMSRNNKSRKGFKIDSMLQKVEARFGHGHRPLCGYLTLTFLGFYNKPASAQEDPVKVETILLKICHKKRKDVCCPVNTVCLGTSYVAYNPRDDYPPLKAPTVSISSDNFSLSGHLVKSYHLVLRVSTLTNYSDAIVAENEVNGGNNLSKKRKRSTEEEKIFGTDLVIYDKQNRCLLADGDYEFYLVEIQPGPITKIAHTLSTWEDICDEMEEVISERQSNCGGSGPVLKVRLKWSKEAVTQSVDYPTPMSRINGILNSSQGGIGNSFGSTVEVGQQDKSANTSGLGKGDEPSSVVYQFVYNNNSKQQTEASYDMHCPWCSINCCTLYSLLKHLKLTHPRFTFSLVPSGSGGVGARIDVSLNEDYDGSYCGAPYTGIGVGSARGVGPLKRIPLSHVIVCHPKRPPPHLAEFLPTDETEFDTQRPFVTGHNRMYHHSTTCLPIYPKEIDIDSEEENDPGWLQKKTQMMIDEFTDVNDGEKELMKMWNLHVMKHGFVGDCQIPLACTMFLEQKGEELLTKNLYRNFVVHMANLFDFGLISPVVVYKTIQQLQGMIIARPDAYRIVKDSCEGHSEQWKEALARQQSPMGVINQSNSVSAGISGSPMMVGCSNISLLGNARTVSERSHLEQTSTPGQRRKPTGEQREAREAAREARARSHQQLNSNSSLAHVAAASASSASSQQQQQSNDERKTRRRLSLPSQDDRKKPPNRRKSFANN